MIDFETLSPTLLQGSPGDYDGPGGVYDFTGIDFFEVGGVVTKRPKPVTVLTGAPGTVSAPAGPATPTSPPTAFTTHGCWVNVGTGQTLDPRVPAKLQSRPAYSLDDINHLLFGGKDFVWIDPCPQATGNGDGGPTTGGPPTGSTLNSAPTALGGCWVKVGTGQTLDPRVPAKLQNRPAYSLDDINHLSFGGKDFVWIDPCP